VSGPDDPHTGNDLRNYKRCQGACKLLRPLRDFATKRDKWCYTCRGLILNPDGKVTVLPRVEAPRPPPKPRANAARLDRDDHEQFKRYMREQLRAYRARKREAAGLPPVKPSVYGRHCLRCEAFKPRADFPPGGGICHACEAIELAGFAKRRPTK
jgi:hypothetical protein